MDANNVLLGDADAPVGSRGLIANLDMTTLPKQEGRLAGADSMMVSCLHPTFFHSDFDI